MENYNKKKLENGLRGLNLYDDTEDRRRELEADLRAQGVPFIDDEDKKRPGLKEPRDKRRRKLEAALERLLGDRSEAYTQRETPKTSHARKASRKGPATRPHGTRITSRTHTTHTTQTTRKKPGAMTPEARKAFAELNEARRALFPENELPDGVEIR